jgi:hypothetical protein
MQRVRGCGSIGVGVRRLVQVLRGAHDGAVTRVYFKQGEPVLISAGADNALKVPPS